MLSARVFSSTVLAALLVPALALAGSAEFPIVNGDEEPGHPAVVALGVSWDGGAISACTGSLITPRMVLTAGHCGAGYDLELVVSIGSAMFGATAAGADRVVGFADLVQHPDYVDIADGAGGMPEADVSVLILATEVEGIRPLPIRTDEINDDDHAGLEGLSVGFGSTSGEGGGGGTKRSAEVVLYAAAGEFLFSRNRDHEDGGGICGGDSGGPMMFQDDAGEWTIWGVHSWGDQNCAVRSGSTRTDVYGEWILEQIEAEHGTRDLCDINGFYEDGACDDHCLEPDPDCGPVGDDDDDAADDDDDDGQACGASLAGGRGGASLLLLSVLARRRGRASTHR